MENFNTSENYAVQDNPETEHFGNPRGRQAQRPYSDLRDLLNQKRQQTNEGKQNNGPPPDPKHNFLSDPMRDNDPDSKNMEPTDDFASARFSTTYNQPHFQTRVSRGGRGRFGSSNRGERRSQHNNNYGNRRDDEWRDERTKIDQERINRQRSDDGGWTREWDAGKEDVPASTNRGRFNQQYRDQNFAQHRKYDNSSKSDKQRWSDSPRSDNHQRSEHQSRADGQVRSDNYSKSDTNFRTTHQSRSGRPTRSDFDNQSKFEKNDNNPKPRSPGRYLGRSYHNPKLDLAQEDNTPRSPISNRKPRYNPHLNNAQSDMDQPDPRSPGKYIDQQDPRSSRKYHDRSNQNPKSEMEQQDPNSAPRSPGKHMEQQQDHRSSRKYQDRSNQNPKSEMEQQDPNSSPKSPGKYMEQQDHRSSRKYQDRSNQNPKLDMDQQDNTRSRRKYQDRKNQNPEHEPDQQDPNTTPRSPRKYGRSNQKPGSDPDQQQDPNTIHRSPRKYQDRSNKNPGSDLEPQDPNTTPRSPRKNLDRLNQNSDQHDPSNTRPPRRYYSGRSNPNPRSDQDPSSSSPRPRQYNPDRSNRGSNQHRPPHRFNPNYRGSKSYTKRNNPNPININVEYSVDTGERKCTYDTIKSEKEPEKKIEEKVQPVRKVQDHENWASVPQVEEEENWDDYEYNEEPGTTLQSPGETNQDDLHDFEEYEPDLDEEFERIVENANTKTNEVDLMSEMKKAEELNDYEDLETEAIEATVRIDEMKKDDLMQIGELKQYVSKLKEILGNEPGIELNAELDQLQKEDSLEELKTSKDDKELKNSKQIDKQDSKSSADLTTVVKHDEKKNKSKSKVGKSKNNSKQNEDVKKLVKQEDKKDVNVPKEQAKNVKQDVKKDSKSKEELNKLQVEEIQIANLALDKVNSELVGEETDESKVLEEI